MIKLYFTKNEIFTKFNILLYNIDKIFFKSDYDSQLILQIDHNNKILCELCITNINGKLHRDITGEHNIDLPLKLALNKFLAIIERNFTKMINLTKLTNVNLKFLQSEPDYESGSN